MSIFIRAMLHSACYAALAALGCGSVSARTLGNRMKKRRHFRRWLLLCAIAISAAAFLGSSLRIGELGIAAGDFALAAAVALLPAKGGIVSDFPIPLSVFISSARYGLKTAALAGGLCGLGLAAAAESLLNGQNGEHSRHKLKTLAFVTYIAAGITELCII